ncbi:hypothetical protein AB0J72_08585 [Dactylosporangium sp. NPDC049742]|uniref:hypothetical protein n=1 Tax=Dactylosporangium sp. NPDC049742 TaxID=3154737 RepID=UPI003449D388
MRPSLIAESRVGAASGEVRPVAGGGWLVTDPDDDATHLLCRRLRARATVDGGCGVVSSDGTHIGTVTDGAVTVEDLHGRQVWRKALEGVTECHLDGRGVLWTLAGDRLGARETATGRPIGEAVLGVHPGWSTWIDDPRGDWTGLAGDRSWLARPTTAGIAVRAIPGVTLTDLHRTEPRYLASTRDGTRLTVRDIATNAVTAGRPTDLGAYLLASAVVDESLVLAAYNLDDHETDLEQHLLLSAATLRVRSVVEYPVPQRDVHRSAEPGTWLTSDDEGLCLWRLDGLLDDDPLPGQQALF